MSAFGTVVSLIKIAFFFCITMYIYRREANRELSRVTKTLYTFQSFSSPLAMRFFILLFRFVLNNYSDMSVDCFACDTLNTS